MAVIKLETTVLKKEAVLVITQDKWFYVLFIRCFVAKYIRVYSGTNKLIF